MHEQDQKPPAPLPQALERVRTIAERWRALDTPPVPLARELERAVDDVRRAAEAEAAAIVDTARADARQVLEAARLELTALVSEIRDLRRERDNARTAGRPGEWSPAASNADSVRDAAAPDAARSDGGPRALPPTRAAALVVMAVVLVVSAVALVVVTNPRVPRGETSPPAEAPPPAPLGTAGASTPVQPAPPTTAGQHLTVQAVRDVWIRPEIDGRRSAGFVLAAGSVRRWTAERGISLRAGDAGAVLVSVDGGTPQPLGRDGQVLTRTFGTAVSPPTGVGPESAPPTATAGATPPLPAETPAEPRLSPVPPLAPPSGDVARSETVLAPPDGAGTSRLPLPASVEATPAPEPSDREALLDRHRRWFAAYYAGDWTTARAFTAPGFDLRDERDEANRPPAAGGAIERMVRDVDVQVAGDGAVVTATLVERAAATGLEYHSRLSEVWVKQDGEWRVLGVRRTPLGPTETRARTAR